MTDLRAMVRPLEFRDEDGDGILTARVGGALMRVIPQAGGFYMAPQLFPPHDKSDDPQVLMDRLNEKHVNRILAALDTAAFERAVAEAVERERAVWMDALVAYFDDLTTRNAEGYLQEVAAIRKGDTP